MKRKAKLVLSNREIGLINRWTIPPRVTEYLEEPSVIIDGDLRIEVPDPSKCQACFQSFSDATFESKVLSTLRELNRAIGYPAKICVDCAWYVEHKRGNVENIPRSIKKKLDSGHCMRLHVYGLNEEEVLCYNLD